MSTATYTPIDDDVEDLLHSDNEEEPSMASDDEAEEKELPTPTNGQSPKAETEKVVRLGKAEKELLFSAALAQYIGHYAQTVMLTILDDVEDKKAAAAVKHDLKKFSGYKSGAGLTALNAAVAEYFQKQVSEACPAKTSLAAEVQALAKAAVPTPPKSANAYTPFMKAFRARMKLEHPTLKEPAVRAALSEAWAAEKVKNGVSSPRSKGSTGSPKVRMTGYWVYYDHVKAMKKTDEEKAALISGWKDLPAEKKAPFIATAKQNAANK